MSAPVDLVLSSGFLAFGAHAGFLAGIEDLGLEVHGVCGTSSGALLGALWASGLPAREVLSHLTRQTPLGWARPCWSPWRGVLRLDAVIAELRERLPATFDGLARPFGVGVATADGGHRLLTTGPLPEAVAASCAVPWLFAPVAVEGAWLADGGAVDRLGISAWRAHRPEAPAVVHLIDRSAGARGEAGLEGLSVVRSPRSGAQLWSLGDVEGAFTRSRAATVATLGASGCSRGRDR